MFKKIYSKFTSQARNNSFFCRHAWLKQFIKFSVAGGACAIIDFLIYILLTRSFPFWANHTGWTNFLSISLASTVNFVWNKKWTFRDNQSDVVGQYLKFWVVVIVGILIYQWIFIFLIRYFHLFDLFSKAAAAVVVWILRFIFNKFWSFK